MINSSGDEVQEPITKIDKIIHEPSRYTIMAYLYFIDIADFLFLLRQTGMTWGNLSAHLGKLETVGYVVIEKEFLGKKPHTTVRLTNQGRNAFEDYRVNMKRVLDNLPDK